MLIQNVSTLNKLSNWFPPHVQYMSKSQKHPPKKKSGSTYARVYGFQRWHQNLASETPGRVFKQEESTFRFLLFTYMYFTWTYLCIGVDGKVLLAGDIVLGLMELTLAGLPPPPPPVEPNLLRLVVPPDDGAVCWKLGDPERREIWSPRRTWLPPPLWGPPGDMGARLVGEEGGGTRGPVERADLFYLRVQKYSSGSSISREIWSIFECIHWKTYYI